MRLQDLLFVLGAVIAIILVLWYLFGNSPTLEQLTLGLLVANLTFSFKIYGDMQRHFGEHTAAQERKNGSTAGEEIKR